MLRGVQDLLGRGRRLGRGPRFEVWAAAAPGRPFYCEAGGLTRPAACAAAERCRRDRPRGEVVVLDESGSPVSD
jgi:hypothetical protein